VGKLLKFNPKQKEFFLSTKGKPCKIKIGVGSVRGGKSFWLVGEIAHIAINEEIEGDLVFMAGNLANVHYNICGAIRECLGEDVLKPYNPKQTEIEFFGRKVRCVGGGTITAEDTIRGWNIASIFCDEVTSIHPNVFDMCMTRLNKPGSCFFGTTNPDSNLHWLKVNILDRNLPDVYHTHFTLDDNPILTQEYKDHLKNTLRGANLQRYYYGQWASADGVVYQDFDPVRHVGDLVDEPCEEMFCGVDFGMNHKTEAVLCAVNQMSTPQIWVKKALCINQTPDDRITIAAIGERIMGWLSHDLPSVIYVDPSAVALKVELRERAPKGVSIVDAKNDVLNGINYISSLFYRNKIKIDFRCTQLINELHSYTWDAKKSMSSGKDEVSKQNDDGVDALRYALYSKFGTSMDTIIKEPERFSINLRTPNYKNVYSGARF
jgi:PBSX family phage terminase large subunit